MVGGIVPLSGHPPQWSLDASKLLVVGEPSGGEANPGPQLYEVDVASGRAATIALEGAPYFAQYLPEARMLVLVDLGTGKWSLRILDLASPDRVIAQLDDIGDVRFDPASGQVYYVRIDSPGLWRSGLDLAGATLLDENEPAMYWMRLWGVLDGKVFALRTATGCPSQWHWMEAASVSGAGCLDREHSGVPQLAPSPSRDGDWLYASVAIGQDSSDIGMLQLDALLGAGAITD